MVLNSCVLTGAAADAFHSTFSHVAMVCLHANATTDRVAFLLQQGPAPLIMNVTKHIRTCFLRGEQKG